MTWSVRRLEPKDDRSGFRSGDADLDRFFARFAGQNQFRHHIGATYVAVDVTGAIGGYATVTPSELSAEASAAAGRKGPSAAPVLRLGRLAVDERHQGQGIGLQLFRHVVALAQRMSEDYGCTGVVVDAKANAVAFYEKVGFVHLVAVIGELADRPAPRPMFLELPKG